MTAHVGMLHTVPALAAGMDADLRRAADGPVRVTHVVDAELLDGAVRSGVDDETLRRVRSHLRHLEAEGAGTILVTCSSIGEVTDDAAAAVTVPVVRVDRAMAERAAALATAPGARPGGIAVLATLEATLGPTTRLVADALAAVDGAAPVHARLVTGAADARGRGDQAEHDRLVADAVAGAAASDPAVVVLAQASMATGVDGRATAALGGAAVGQVHHADGGRVFAGGVGDRRPHHFAAAADPQQRGHLLARGGPAVGEGLGFDHVVTAAAGRQFQVVEQLGVADRVGVLHARRRRLGTVVVPAGARRRRSLGVGAAHQEPRGGAAGRQDRRHEQPGQDPAAPVVPLRRRRDRRRCRSRPLDEQHVDGLALAGGFGAPASGRFAVE